MPLLKCPHCGQTYNPRYIQYCARCGEAVPDESGKVPKPGPLDGLGARGGSAGRKPSPSTAPAADAAPPAEDWHPTHAVDDMVLEYRNKLNQTPEDHTTRYALALAYLFAKRWDAAERELEQVILGLPDYADAHFRLALCRAKQAKLKMARDAVCTALNLAPDNQHFQTLADNIERAIADES